jgi:nucleoside 2-deoxyribosyltransferase
MVNKTVYLAGPISGLSYGEANDWRQEVRDQLLRSGIKPASPLRAKVYIRDTTQIDQASPAIDENDMDSPAIQAMSNSRGITTRDRFDCLNCDVVFVNLLGTERVSIGTVMEIAWADALRKPIVLVMEEEGNLHDHAMIRECIGFRVPTIREGVEITKAILGDY